MNDNHEFSMTEIEASLRRSCIPPNMHGGILRWIEDGTVPGSFLVAVISNDFKDACFKADDYNALILPVYARWFHNNAPAKCWGSLDNFVGWAKKLSL